MTGQSGLQRSPHYSDQASIYHSGRYRTVKFDGIYQRDNTMRKLLLIPPKSSEPNSFYNYLFPF